MKAYKYRIYANKQTTEKLAWVLDRCRELYNAALQERCDCAAPRSLKKIICSGLKTISTAQPSLTNEEASSESGDLHANSIIPLSEGSLILDSKPDNRQAR